MTASAVRPPAVSGRFYPADPAVLAADVDRFLAEGLGEAPAPHAVVVPHAGYPYSGPVAGSSYRLVAARAGTVERVVLLGPAHFSWVPGLAVSSVAAFDTPLGRVPVDAGAREQALAASAAVAVDDEAHRPEHSLEVQLPFLQRCLDEVPVLPLLVGQPEAATVADVLQLWWDDPGTLVVVSTDLSHYEDYATARRLDTRTAEAVVGVRPEDLGDRDACGAYALRGLLTLAWRRGAGVRLLDLRSSGDTAGPRDRVVGYGAFAVVDRP
jgi:AmmeMemoRadiSam system protein B